MTHQSQTSAPQCFPDEYLNQERIEALFNDFKFNLSVELPDASVFSNLVNGVRQLYMTELLLQQRVIVQQSEQHKQELSKSNEQYKKLLSQISSSRDQELPVYAEEPVAQELRTGNVLPANTCALHVGSATDPRRDMVDWVTYEPVRLGWTERFMFKAFKFQEIDTIKVVIAENSPGGPHRMNVFLPTSVVPLGWNEKRHFYAFESWRPNTQMISVGQADDPERCILVREDHADKLRGWTEKFVFWVPVQ